MAGDKNIGTLIGGSYRLVAKLGGGGFGDVYQGQHIFFKNRPPVAIKLLRASLHSPKERDRFIQEAELLNMLSHPHILPVLEAGLHEEDLPFIITEYAPGGSLQDRLDRKPSQPMAVDEAISLLTQIGEALHYAHQQNIVHRDLKPDNILFNAKGEAVLADFGIAAILSSAHTREAGDAGTPAYMAPEMFEGKVSTKSDQYALGCIAYELLTGRKAFDVDGLPAIVVQYQHAKVEPDAPTKHNAKIPAYVEQAILTALAKDRSQRHADVRTFLLALQAQALQKTAKQWVEEGNTLFYKQQYEDALVAYERAIRLNPKYAEAYTNKGLALDNLKRYEEAIANFEQAIRLDPNDALVYNGKGWTLNELERYQEALVAFEQAIRLNANNAFAYSRKGYALTQLKRYQEALVAFEQAIRLDPKLDLAYHNKGVALEKLGRKQEAQQAYERAKQLGYKD